MTKPNTKFELTVRDIEVIEQALRAKAGRRGMSIAQGDTSETLYRRPFVQYTRIKQIENSGYTLMVE